MTRRSRIALALLAFACGTITLCALVILLVAVLLVDGVFVLFDWRAELSVREAVASVALLAGTISLFVVAARILWRDGVKRFLHPVQSWAERRMQQQAGRS